MADKQRRRASRVAAYPSVFGGGAPRVLASLALSNTYAVVGRAYSQTISGRSAGSALSALASDGTALAVSGSTLSGTFASSGSKTVTLVETLAGATGSPRTTTLTVTVSPDLSANITLAGRGSAFVSAPLAQLVA